MVTVRRKYLCFASIEVISKESIYSLHSVLFVYAAKHQLYMYVDDCSWFGLMDYREPTSREHHRLTALLVP